MSTQKKGFPKRQKQFKSAKQFKRRDTNLIYKLHDVKKLQNNENQKVQISSQCQYGSFCAHLRVKGQCQFLHQKKDYVTLGLSVPQNCLEDQEPLKKTKQQRKQDKIRQRAERQERGKARQNNKQQEQKQEQKKIENIDIKQQIVLNLISCQQGEKLSVQKLYKNLNILTEAYVKKQSYPFQEPSSFQLHQTSFTFSEMRRRLLMKMKKKDEMATIYKQFLQKQSIIIKKIIKNVQKAYDEQIKQAINTQAFTSVDLRVICSKIMFKQIQQILNSKKQSLDLINYYSKFFEKQFGFPLNAQSFQNVQQLNKGGLLPLKNVQLLYLTSTQILFLKTRVFYAYPVSSVSENQMKGVFDLKNLLIPFKILNKEAFEKNMVINISNSSFKNIGSQIMNQYASQVHQKLKSPGDFVFGSLVENIKKFKLFLKKYKQKIILQNKENKIILIIVGLNNLLQKLAEKGLEMNTLKEERNLQQQNLYEKAFLLKELIQMIGDKVIYLDDKKIKFKKYSELIKQIDDKSSPVQIEKITEQK